jgi:hypothetical protein
MSRPRCRVGVYPGTFNPFTLAHLAVAQAALAQRQLDRIHLSVSRVPLAKAQLEIPQFVHRIEALQDVTDQHDWLDLVVTEARLFVDIARGYDVLIMGADKWHQIHDVQFYNNSETERDAAMAALPEVALAPRPPYEVPDELELVLPDDYGHISSTAVRDGAHHWMHPAKAAFDARTGAWSDPERYRQMYM